MQTRRPKEIEAAWKGPEVRDSGRWVRCLTQEEIGEIDAAFRHARRLGLGFRDVTRETFPLPVFAAEAANLREVLENGLGLRLLRGFPVEDYGKDDLKLIYWGIGSHVGTAISQSKRGDVLGDVLDLGLPTDSPQGRGYTSNDELSYHPDSCDVTALFCLRTAKSGGLSRIASSVTVRNEILRRCPDLLEVLYRPFWWSRQGQELPGQAPIYPQPIFAEHEGRFMCRYIRNHIKHAQRHEEAPRLSVEQNEALDLLDAIAADPAIHFEMMFEPGDLQFLNNHVMFHTRTAFEDWPEPDRKRHLLRMWLSVPNSRALPDSFAAFYRDTRAGSVRGGFPGHRETEVYETKDRDEPAVEKR
jgi:hypothetical protein